MKFAVGLFAGLGTVLVLADLLDQRIQLIEFGLGDIGRRQGRRLALEQDAGLGQLESGDIEAGMVVLAGQPQNIGARTDANLEQPLHFERDHRLAHGGAADIIFGAEIALGRQTVAHLIFPRGQFVEQSARQLLIEPIMRPRGIAFGGGRLSAGFLSGLGGHDGALQIGLTNYKKLDRPITASQRSLYNRMCRAERQIA